MSYQASSIEKREKKEKKKEEEEMIHILKDGSLEMTSSDSPIRFKQNDCDARFEARVNKELNLLPLTRDILVSS